MMSAAFLSDVHLIWYVVLAVPIIHLIISLVSIVMTQSRAMTLHQRNVIGLKISFIAEIDSIVRIVGENIERLRAKSDCVMTLRPLAVVYRGNLARLSLLDDSLNAEIVRVYGTIEHLDAKVCSYSKQQGALAYKLNPDGLSPATLLLDLIELRCGLEKLGSLLQPTPEETATARETIGNHVATVSAAARTRTSKLIGPLLQSSRQKTG